jgi:hypothetical protein
VSVLDSILIGSDGAHRGPTIEKVAIKHPVYLLLKSRRLIVGDSDDVIEHVTFINAHTNINIRTRYNESNLLHFPHGDWRFVVEGDTK